MKRLALLGVFVCCILATGARAQPNITVIYGPQAPPPPVIVMPARPLPPPVVEMPAAPRQTGFLIAFKDSVIRLAQQYWVKGDTLYYVTMDHQQRTASLENVDRNLSQLLNSEQDVAFALPPAQERVAAQAHLTHTAATARKRCYCTSTPVKGTAARMGSAARTSK